MLAMTFPIPGINRIKAWRQGLARQAFRRDLERIARSSLKPFFVKVGAHDGLTGDPCTEFLLADAKWRGLLIEPIPTLAEKLRERFGDRGRFTIIQMAVGEAEGMAAFHYVTKDAEANVPDLPEWYDQLSSFDASHIEKHLGHGIRPFIGAMNVAVKPLSRVLEDHDIQVVDLLQIDTEGHDLIVLRSLGLGRHRPSIIFVEHKHLAAQDRKALLHLLASNGYKVMDCGGDFYAKLISS